MASAPLAERQRLLSEAFRRGDARLSKRLAVHTRWVGAPVSQGDSQDAEPQEAEELVRTVTVDAVRENDNYAYRIVTPTWSRPPFRRAIVLLHGLNERRWDKYLPWVEALVERTGAPVVLFPISFHMERSPALWSEPHAMHVLAKSRGKTSSLCSFANAALSTRLSQQPGRFFWSGLRTVHDLVAWSKQVSAGTEPLLSGATEFALFGYSIGAFLSLILASTRGTAWENARVFAFCGGCTLHHSNPLSKEILDGRATASLREHFDGRYAHVRATDAAFSRALDGDPAGMSFDNLIHPARLSARRNEMLAGLAPRLRMIALARDAVMPADSIVETLGAYAGCVRVADFPFPYTHANPLPWRGGPEGELERAFDLVFDEASKWLAEAA